MSAALAAAVAAAVSLGAARPAQIPREFRNLQVLPAGISRPELIARMRTIATELGVRCSHCHMGPDDLTGMDFATDEIPAKRVARQMIAMVDTINSRYISALPGGADRQPVTCVTCHRRAEKPTRPLYEVLLATASASGIDAAVARYREIREALYGSGLYDFRPHTLNIAGNRLMEEKRPLEALAFHRLNAEMFPADADVQAWAGQSAQANGDTALAEAYFRRALEIAPGHRGALRGLAEIRR